MTQKILKVGTSAAVTMSKKVLGALELSIGDEVEIKVEPKKRAVTIEPTREIRPELLNWTDGFIRKYRKALDELARK
jgi:antitoxin component of MazEF toxin-antitoxin module